MIYLENLLSKYTTYGYFKKLIDKVRKEKNEISTVELCRFLKVYAEFLYKEVHNNFFSAELHIRTDMASDITILIFNQRLHLNFRQNKTSLEVQSKEDDNKFYNCDDPKFIEKLNDFCDEVEVILIEHPIPVVHKTTIIKKTIKNIIDDWDSELKEEFSTSIKTFEIAKIGNKCYAFFEAREKEDSIRLLGSLQEYLEKDKNKRLCQFILEIADSQLDYKLITRHQKYVTGTLIHQIE